MRRAYRANGRVVMYPNHEELGQAFEAGFQSIDEGDTFYTGFDNYLHSIGYRKQQDIRCTCSDGGEHGHMPECRWVKV